MSNDQDVDVQQIRRDISSRLLAAMAIARFGGHIFSPKAEDWKVMAESAALGTKALLATLAETK